MVVLAAWAAQNPRLMLNSATDKHAKGLANSSGLLGKYMMAHFSSGTWALFDEDVQNYMGTIGAQFMSYERYGKTSQKGAFGSSFITAGSALKTSDLGGFANARLDLFGPDARRFHETRRARTHPHRRVRRGDAEHREPHRARKRQGRVRHAARPRSSTATIKTRRRCGTPISRRASRSLRRPAPRRSGRRAATCRPSTCSAAPSWARTPATRSPTATARPTRSRTCMSPGPRIFPTEGASNPTYTIFALSLRAAEQLASSGARWRGDAIIPRPASEVGSIRLRL